LEVPSTSQNQIIESGSLKSGGRGQKKRMVSYPRCEAAFYWLSHLSVWVLAFVSRGASGLNVLALKRVVFSVLSCFSRKGSCFISRLFELVF